MVASGVPSDDLRRLRSLRNPRDRDLSIGAVVRTAEKELRKKVKSLGGVADAWDTVVPLTLARRCRLVSLSRGVLSVQVADSSARFELDRFLRAGGEAELVRRARAAIKRIKLSV